VSELKKIEKKILRHCSICVFKLKCNKWVGPACVVYGGEVEPNFDLKAAVDEVLSNG
jgi:hypothetical protein